MVSSKDKRIANRLRVLQTWVLHPEWHGTRIGKEAGGTCRYEFEKKQKMGTTLVTWVAQIAPSSW